MPTSQFVLKCPHCNEEFQVQPPDNWHSACSYEEPRMSKTHGEVKSQEMACQNGKCGKKINIYWYAPMEYFDRM